MLRIWSFSSGFADHQLLWDSREQCPPCRLEASRVASGFMLQKRRASPMCGRTERPALAHSVNSSQSATKLLFTCDAGNTVSPPASTSLLLHPSPSPPAFLMFNPICSQLNSTICSLVPKKFSKTAAMQSKRQRTWVEVTYRYISTVAIRWPPFFVLNVSWK